MLKLKDCFSSWILPRLGIKELNALSRYDILLFRSAFMDAKLGINRQYGVLMALKLFLRFCRQVLRVNCLDPDTEIKLPQRPKPHVHYLTNEEAQRLRAGADAGIDAQDRISRWPAGSTFGDRTEYLRTTPARKPMAKSTCQRGCAFQTPLQLPPLPPFADNSRQISTLSAAQPRFCGIAASW